MSQFPGDESSKILASGYKYNPFGSIVAKNDPRYNQQKPSLPNKDPKTPQGIPTNDPTNPESQFEYLLGIRMTKKQKWAVVIGGTLALWALLIYSNKKK
jgi:hypothetical protein